MNMRIVIAGAGHVCETFARKVRQERHEIVIIDESRDRIDELSKSLDASFLCGKATNPDILREADPSRTDLLLCLTDNDETNLIIAVLGRSLGIDRVIPSIARPEMERLISDLDLNEAITPASTIADLLISKLNKDA